ncbi:U2 snRNP-associated SURP motif-containing protein-like [Panonychus citri]|uniref:U2 snRNP-associated SURP motif-containing protein-like n=1 Tax=Panonychus citri TaxID=50023 RepID=UPI0023076C68|nr:U2 snRNP-associated SURP motif-containing protein-like [Panonychus citri]XP_053211969.1 U2 snRNP-associated SURP motif-containing protein-like [Panonychus citri]XP_053211970.1 U2 snRNP-associated SURP motif-containing protein-like [Panonychus citri]XP_053211971.1 U2 snRNP-associated SURP motif-containing protein-like [Panonychus citri]
MNSDNSIGKIKSFNLVSKKPLSKKELEKHKKEQEEKDAAKVYQEFVETFEKPPTVGRLFVLGSVMNSGHEEEKDSLKVYKPNKLQELEEKKKRNDNYHSSESTSITPPKMEKLGKKKEKKKSNLELFKEELRQIQEEREERHRLKTLMVKEEIKEIELAPKSEEVRTSSSTVSNYGSFDTGDPNTTNIYLGNINPKMSEKELMQIFGVYGPLASVKIMWPRSDEERARNRNCGFVAFMSRKDGERALKALNGKEIQGYEMKLGWGKAVPIPPHPIYIPPKLLELTMPPPPSGLPFNAQPDPSDLDKLPPPGVAYPMVTPKDRKNFEKVLANATVKVVIPTDRTVLCLIHRMIEFVVKEGPMFEAMIMNQEINNPIFRFLFDNQSPAHIYYRWRLYSILQGEHPSKWRTEEFRLFKGGSKWKPPPLNPFLEGMPEHLVEKSPEKEHEPEPKKPWKKPRSRSIENDVHEQRGFKEFKDKNQKKGILTDVQREELEDILRDLTPERVKISEGMVYCIEHADAAGEIVDCIAESLAILETPLYKKIARLYLISDILHNCCVKVSNASYYRKGFQSRLTSIFSDIHQCFNAIEGRLKAEQFKHRVMNCFKAWEDWAIYTSDFLIKLQNIFLGLNLRDCSSERKAVDSKEIDGDPVEESDIDGIPIDTIDGTPFESTINISTTKFKPSKWETVDPDLVESQAMTTSKWESLETNHDDGTGGGVGGGSSGLGDGGDCDCDDDDDDIDGKPIDGSPFIGITNQCLLSSGSNVMDSLKPEIVNENDGRRVKLREIELKVLKFQDELESSRKSKKNSQSIESQVDEYRTKLLRKYLNEQEDSQSRSRSRSKSRSNSRSHSRSRSRSRSHSPRISHSRSPSSHHSYHHDRRQLSSKRSRSRSRSRSPYGKGRRGSSRDKRHHHSRSPRRRSRSPHRSKRR